MQGSPGGGLTTEQGAVATERGGTWCQRLVQPWGAAPGPKGLCPRPPGQNNSNDTIAYGSWQNHHKNKTKHRSSLIGINKGEFLALPPTLEPFKKAPGPQTQAVALF